MPVLDPVQQPRLRHQDAGARSEDAVVEDRSDVRRLRPIGAASRSGTARPRRTIRCSTTRAAPGSRRASTARRRPAFCRKGSDHPSAKASRSNEPGAQLSMYDPKTAEVHADRHLLQHPSPAVRCRSNRLWAQRRGGTGNGDIVGWLDVKKFEETGDEQKSQGWTPFVLDTNGNGKRDDYVEPNQPVDPTKDKRVVAGFYGIAPSPADGTIWGIGARLPGRHRAGRSRLRSAQTALSEVYEVPAPGYSPRGIDIDSKGVVWTPLASGHIGELRPPQMQGPAQRTDRDRQALPRRLDALSDARTAVRDRDRIPAASEASYYTWVDQHDTFGLGKDIPIATGNNSNSLHALVDGKFVELRVPYPMGFFAKGMDGRIDDPNAGWKGTRAVDDLSATARPSITKAAKARKPKVVKFQLRPDPLAH